MKPTTILSSAALLTPAFAANHAVVSLLARAIDPSTMDPTRLSVLSVLKTAMPTPSSGADIVLPTGTAMPLWYKDLPADVMVLLAQMYPATATAAAAAAAGSNSGGIANVLSSQTLTTTLAAVSTDVGSADAANATGPSLVSAAATTTDSGSLSPSGQSASSIAAKNAIAIEKWSIVTGLGVAAVFCLFA